MGYKKALVLALMALVIAGVGLWFAHRPLPPPQEATQEEVRGEAARGGYHLITTEELARVYREAPPNLLLVDTRQDWEYRTGHIRGAVNFPMEPTWYARWRAQGPLTALLEPHRNKGIVFY
jgi:predicted sulfurtransferase